MKPSDDNNNVTLPGQTRSHFAQNIILLSPVRRSHSRHAHTHTRVAPSLIIPSHMCVKTAISSEPAVRLGSQNATFSAERVRWQQETSSSTSSFVRVPCKLCVLVFACLFVLECLIACPWMTQALTHTHTNAIFIRVALSRTIRCPSSVPDDNGRQNLPECSAAALVRRTRWLHSSPAAAAVL